MGVVVVLLYIAAGLFAAAIWRTRVRRRRTVARPVLTCAEVAGTAPGVAVVVAGLTADGPRIHAPMSGTQCVWYEDRRGRTTIISSNSEETTWTVDAQDGDAHVYDADHRAGVLVDPELGKRQLAGGLEPMMQAVVWDRDGGRDNIANSYDRVYEHMVPPYVAVVVAGVVEGEGDARRLRKGSWVDGTAQARLEELPRRHVRFQRVRLAFLLAFALAAVALTVV